MSTKFQLKKYVKIDKDQIYVLQFTYQPSLEEIRSIQEHFEKIYKETGAKFIILGSNLKLLSPARITDCPEIVEEIELMFNKALVKWKNEQSRIITL